MNGEITRTKISGCSEFHFTITILKKKKKEKKKKTESNKVKRLKKLRINRLK